MKYLMITTRELPDLRQISCTALLLEVDEDGNVTREVGVQSSGEIVHCAPVGSSFFFASTRKRVAQFSRYAMEPAHFSAAWEAAGN